MVKSKRTVTSNDQVKDEVNDFTKQLIKDINAEFGTRVAYNLSEGDAPTVVKRWINTGSIQLDYAIRNAANGGYPEGRIIELTGLPSSGKSHLAYHAAAVVQSLGGLVVYVDTENATPIDKLGLMGIDIARRFVYVDTHCTEEVFKVIESTIIKAKNILAKDIPILVIWDSLAATSPLAELNGEYEQNTMGLQARVVSKGIRKIIGVIGQNNVTLLIINQLREKFNVMGHGDPYVSPGGKAVPFHASIRIRLGSGAPVKDKAGNVVGIHVTFKVNKNKVAAPFRKGEFDIIFGSGIVEHEYLFDECRSYCADNKIIIDTTDENGKLVKLDASLTGTSAWKSLIVSDVVTGEAIIEKKFHKSEFGEIMSSAEYAPFVSKIIETALTRVSSTPVASEGETPDTDEGTEEDN